MKKRLSYEAPEGELILVQFEDNYLASPNDGFGDNNAAGQGFGTRTYEDEF